MLDRLTGMQVFSRVATEGSLSGAARALGMSQTMATKHMAALEVRLGVKLLHRTTRKVTLTDAGRRYLESVERVLAELVEADATAAAERVEVSGNLRVNAPVSLGIRELGPLLLEFSRIHPALTVDLGLTDRAVDLIDEGWDLAIRVGHIRNESLVARTLAPCRLSLAASPAYLAKHGTPRTVHDLVHHNCLGYNLSSALGPHRWPFGAKGEVELPVRGTLQANNGDVLVSASVAGLGIVYEPTFILGDDIRAGRLVQISLDHAVMEVPGVYAVYPANRRPTAKVRAFIDFLASRFRPIPPWDRDLIATS